MVEVTTVNEPEGAPPSSEDEGLRRVQPTPGFQDGVVLVEREPEVNPTLTEPAIEEDATGFPIEEDPGRQLSFDLGSDDEDDGDANDIVAASPERRSFRRFVREARTQSMGTGARYSAAAEHRAAVEE